MQNTELETIVTLAVRKALELKTLEIRQDNRLAYTIDEAAPLVGLNRNTLRDAISRGELKAVKRGMRWMIRKDLLLKWLEPKGM